MTIIIFHVYLQLMLLLVPCFLASLDFTPNVNMAISQEKIITIQTVNIAHKRCFIT